MVPLVQLSVKVASNSVPTKVYWQRPGSVSRVPSGVQVISGSSLSSTIIVKEPQRTIDSSTHPAPSSPLI